MRLASCIACIALAISPLVASAQSYTLDQAQNYAELHSYRLLEADNDIDDAKASVNEVISSGLPQVTGSVSYNNFLRQPVQVVPAEFFGGEPGTFAEVVFGTEQNATADITANQLLFDGSYIIGLKAAREVVELSRMQKKLTKQEVRKSVYDAYAMVLAAEENYKTLKASAENLEKIAEQTTALKEAGLTDDISVSQLKINLSNVQNAVVNAETQIQLSKNLLKYNMGLPITAEISLISDLSEFTQGEMSDLMIDQFTAMRTTEFQLARQNITLQEFRFKAERASYLPRLSAFFNHQQQAFRQQFDFLSNTDDYFAVNLVGINLSVPIFTSLKKHHQVSQKKLAVEKAQINATKVREGMELEISNAQANLKNELNNYKVQETNLDLASRIREQTRIKFSEGLASSFDLNQAETQFLDAQAKYIGAIINLSDAKSSLYKLLNK